MVRATSRKREARIRIGVALAVAIPAALLASTAFAELPELDHDTRKALASLGEGVVGKAIPAKPIPNLHDFVGIREGTYHYRVVGEKGDDAKYAETFEKIPKNERGATMKRTRPDFVDHMKVTEDGDVYFTTELDTDLGYLVHLSPHGSPVGLGLAPGESRKASAKLDVFKEGDESDRVYQGSIDSTITYLGAFEVTVPAGTFEAVLFRDDFEIKVGPADVRDVRYTFISKDAFKVAAVERLNISALLIYHSNTQTPIVLVDYPR